jgi:acyl-coenzyme A thioesterase PaaI-like protein
MIPTAAGDVLSKVRRDAHPKCIVCSSDNENGFQLAFVLTEGGGVEAAFRCETSYQGYPGILHGGVISSVLDGAMTNCLFAHGHQGITGELRIRFRYPVITDRNSVVRAWIESSAPPFHVLKAELIQDQQVKAWASGKFAERVDGGL